MVYRAYTATLASEFNARFKFEIAENEMWPKDCTVRSLWCVYVDLYLYKHDLGLFHWHGLILIQAWISDHMPSKV